MHYAFHDFIGNIGLVLLLGTYLLLQMGKIDSTRPLYSLLNALAALLIDPARAYRPGSRRAPGPAGGNGCGAR